MKRTLSVILAIVMLAFMSVTAFAATGTNTITINGIADGHTYAAYQLFSGDRSSQPLKQTLPRFQILTAASLLLWLITLHPLLPQAT